MNEVAISRYLSGGVPEVGEVGHFTYGSGACEDVAAAGDGQLFGESLSERLAATCSDGRGAFGQGVSTDRR